jgi:hypothetical protein
MPKLRIVAIISMVSAFLTANYPAVAQDMTPKPLHQISPQRGSNLHESTFAVMSVQEAKPGSARIVGSAFVIRQNPLTLLTCYHVVSRGSEMNNGSFVYLIGKRIDEANESNLEKDFGHFLPIKRLIFKPDYDLAILEIDPAANPEISSKLRLSDAKPLELDFDRAQRAAGTAVMWSTNVTPSDKDFLLHPRLFFSNIVASYVTNETYNYTGTSGASTKQTMNAVTMLEVDKPFFPGASGSAIVNVATNKVIGIIHGLRMFQNPSGQQMTGDAQLFFGLLNIKMKNDLPMVVSLSLGVDLRTVESYLKQAGYVSE